jgi:NAD(P)-dependent dehydrogenase (short-subunit alcohol dehydrogenase family)
MTQTAQMEHRRSGIQFTTFIPGFTATPMARWLEHAGISHDELVQPDDLGEAAEAS